ncbi:MAG: hypothetical protein H0T13_06180 [Actinobacteria bacterium]|nr:hypothetical protein [Actinomycetota bacterium]
MDSTFRKVALAAATLGLLLSLFIALRPDDGDDAAIPATTAAAETVAPPALEGTPATTVEAPPPEPAFDTVRAVIAGGRPQGGVKRQTIEQGRDVVLVVRSDIADHVHLHGYDLMADVGPGTPARLRFTADVPGRFEVELEEAGIHIADLEVRP